MDNKVYFANPLGIENILSRVTGNNLSNVLGTLGVDGGANLFLLNPNGIIFGANASLDITGSFVASTANRFVFGNSSEFSATNPQAPSLLTINLPPGLQYGANHPGVIANTGNLAVGQDLTLSAGNLDLQGQLYAGRNLTLQAQDTVRVRDSVTNPFIAAASHHLLLQGNQVVDIFALNHPDSGFFSGGDMALRSAKQVGGDAHYWTGGSFRIEQLDGTLGDLFSLYDPIIRSVGDVSFSNYFGTSLHIFAGGSVTIPGLVVITGPEIGTEGVDYIAEDVALSNGTVVSIDGRARPTFDVRAGMNPGEVGIPGVTGDDMDFFISGFFEFFGFLIPIQENPAIPNTATSADINIGGIAMIGSNAADGMVFLTNQYRPNSSLPGGDIEVGVIVTADNFSGAFDQLPDDLLNLLNSFGVPDSFIGNGGDVILDSRSNIALKGSALTDLDVGLGLDVGLDFSLINTSSATGDAGDITLVANDAVFLTNTFILSDTSGFGSGGDVAIKAGSVSLTDGTLISTSTSGTGLGGNLSVDASESVELVNSNLLATTVGDGEAGDLSITTGKLTVRDASVVASLTYGNGDAGDLRIDTEQLIVKDGVIATSTLQDGSDGALLTNGRGGELIINASDSVELIGTAADGQFAVDIPILDFVLEQIPIGLFSTSQSLGDAGNLSIATRELIVRGGAAISASTLNAGQGGDLLINASERVELRGTSSGSGDQTIASALLSESNGSGDGGNIVLTTPELIIRDGAIISAGAGVIPLTTATIGNAGNLTITANLIELSGTSANLETRSALLTATAGSGDAGDLQIDTNQLIVRDGAVILAATFREGSGGSLTINATDSIKLVGTASDNLPSSLSSGTAGTGASGDLTLNTRALTIQDGAVVSVATYAQGTGGNLAVNASEIVELVGTAADGRPSSLSAASGLEGVSSIPLLQTFGVDPSQATGESGNLSINTERLIIRDRAEASAATLGGGVGGTLTVTATESVNLSDGGRLTTETQGAAAAGSLTIDTRQLIVQDDALVSASTSGSGEGGSLQVRATESVFLNQGRLLTQSSAAGSAGDVMVDTQQLTLQAGAEVSAATTSSQGGDITIQGLDRLQVLNSLISASTETGIAGSVTVNASESMQLSGSGGLSVEATNGGTAGSLTLETGELSVQDGAQVTVSSPEGQAGNMTITANTLLLNQGRLTAETGTSSAEGGANITLSGLDFLLMDNESLISASALAAANGGNINIDSQFIVALPPQGVEGSDIVANAVEGNGGRVNITTEGLFGIDFRPSRTPENDITASSEFGIAGEVTITRPDVDPSRGLAELPTDLVDAEGLVDRSCQSGGTARRSSFAVTGRGGLPLNPTEPLSSDAVWQDLRSPAQQGVNRSSQNVQREELGAQTAAPSTAKIVEAQGWIIDLDGKVVLTAQAPTPTPGNPLRTSPSCQDSLTSTRESRG
jgi:filamentous hemagglutinin family protein